MDWVDLHVKVPAVPLTQLAEMPQDPTSAEVREQVLGGTGSAVEAVRAAEPAG